MKKIGHFLVLILATGAWSLTSWVDTSILKTGNVWVYSRQESYQNSLNPPSTGFSGTMKFTIDSLRLIGNVLTFNVIREDSGVHSETYSPPPSIGPPFTNYTDQHTFQTTQFQFSNGAYSPSPPFFANGQNFSDAMGKVIYQNDTLRVNNYSNNFAVGCSFESSENIEKIGRTKYCPGRSGGNTLESLVYTLLSLNGDPFEPANVVVGLRRDKASRKPGDAPARGILWDNHRVLFGKGTEGFDVRGQRVLQPAR